MYATYQTNQALKINVAMDMSSVWFKNNTIYTGICSVDENGQIKSLIGFNLGEELWASLMDNFSVIKMLKYVKKK